MKFKKITAILTCLALSILPAIPAQASSGWDVIYWNGNANYCLADPTGGGTGGSGTGVVIWWCQNGANFLWQQVEIGSGPYKGMFHLEVAQNGGLCLYDHQVQVRIQLQVVTCNDTWAGQAFLGNELGYIPPPQDWPWTWFNPNEPGTSQYSMSMPYTVQNGARVISDYRLDSDIDQQWDGPGSCFELMC